MASKLDRLDTDPDYVSLPKFDYSMDKLLQKFPEGVSDDVIAQALELSVGQVEELYRSAVRKLRSSMKVTG